MVFVRNTLAVPVRGIEPAGRDSKLQQGGVFVSKSRLVNLEYPITDGGIPEIYPPISYYVIEYENINVAN